MSNLWDGNGNVVRSNGVNSGAATWQADRNAGTKILATRHDTHDQNLADTIEHTLNRDGENSPTANISWANFKITNLAVGTSATDAANISQIAAQRGVWCGTAGGTANALTVSPSPAITAYAAGMRFTLIIATTNTTAATLVVSGLAVLAIHGVDNAVLVGGELVAGMIVAVIHDGTQFRLESAPLSKLRNMTGGVRLAAVDNGAGAMPIMDFYRFSSSPGANDVLGTIKFTGRNAGAEDYQYAAIAASIIDAGDGTEIGQLSMAAQNGLSAGASLNLTTVMRIEADNARFNVADQVIINRLGSGTLISFQKNDATEGTISVSGSVVSYNGFVGAHHGAWLDPAMNDDPPPVGTWLETTDTPWEIPGQSHEGLCLVRVARVGSKRVAGVYIGDHIVEGQHCGILIAAVGGPTMCRWIGPAEGGDFAVIVDDGVAGPQEDGIRRNTTAGKVWRGDGDESERLVSVTFECGG